MKIDAGGDENVILAKTDAKNDIVSQSHFDRICYRDQRTFAGCSEFIDVADRTTSMKHLRASFAFAGRHFGRRSSGISKIEKKSLKLRNKELGRRISESA